MAPTAPPAGFPQSLPARWPLLGQKVQGDLLANPWSTLGVRKSCDIGQLWSGYAEALRQTFDERKRQRVRDAFDAIRLGLWGKFAESLERCDVQAHPAQAWSYDGPLSNCLTDLDRLLSASGPVEKTELTQRVEALFDDPAMLQAEIYLRVEPALAELLESHLPKSESVLTLALDRFHRLTEQARDHPGIARLMDRAEDADLVEALDSGGAPHSNGWRSLHRPASRFQRWFWARDDRRNEIAALYSYAGWFNPKIRSRIDTEEWAWWSAELSEYRTSFATIIAWLGAAVLIGVAADQFQAPLSLAIGIGAATFAFLFADDALARRVAAQRTPKPFDRPLIVVLGLSAVLLPFFTRLLPPHPSSVAIVAGLAIAIAWAMRSTTVMSGGTKSTGWLDSTGVPAFVILFFALWLPIPWPRYAMLASYVWLLHAVFPDFRRPLTMALERLAGTPWGMLFAVGGALTGLAAVFAAQLDINRESTRLALLVVSYALFSLSNHFRRPFPTIFAFAACMLIGGFLVFYCRNGGEYHPGPKPSAGETLLSAYRGDVLDWSPFPANGEDILERMKRDNPQAYARLIPVMRGAKCDLGRDGGRECEAYELDAAIYAELGKLLMTMSNSHLTEFTKLESRAREAQYRSGSGACSAQTPIFDKLSPKDIRHDHGALVLDIIASGPRPVSERPSVPLPDQPTFERALETAFNEISAIGAGPIDPRLKQSCIGHMIRARAMLRFEPGVTARIARTGYP